MSPPYRNITIKIRVNEYHSGNNTVPFRDFSVRASHIIVIWVRFFERAATHNTSDDALLLVSLTKTNVLNNITIQCARIVETRQL